MSNQARFIMENIEEDFRLVKMKEEPLIRELVRRGFDSDPEKEWKKRNDQKYATDIQEDSDTDPGKL